MGRHILLVEDRDGHQEAIRKFVLEPLGYKVTLCKTLDELIAAVAALKTSPEGVLLDFNVPRRAGQAAELEAGRDCGLYLRGLLRGHLSETPLTIDVPIIAYTEYRDDRIGGWKDLIGIKEVLVKRGSGIDVISKLIEAHFT